MDGIPRVEKVGELRKREREGVVGRRGEDFFFFI